MHKCFFPPIQPLPFISFFSPRFLPCCFLGIGVRDKMVAVMGRGMERSQRRSTHALLAAERSRFCTVSGMRELRVFTLTKHAFTVHLQCASIIEKKKIFFVCMHWYE